jgi:ankyrin repeat protein
MNPFVKLTKTIALLLILLFSYIECFAQSAFLSSQFIDAIRNNDLATIKEMVNKGYDVSDYDILDTIIDTYDDVTKIVEHETLVEEAIAGKADEALIKYLINRGADIHIHEAELLISAANLGYTNKFIQYLINQGVNVNAQKNNASVLMWSVYQNQMALFELLKKNGAEAKGFITSKWPDYARFQNDDNDGFNTAALESNGYYSSPVGIAAGKGYLDFLKLLIEKYQYPTDADCFYIDR